ncbi:MULTISPECIES: DUF6460 domain-containing protein [Alphaproteobacteria]|uniref:DUF6460 domain-containing protein n=2 Tax=Alphaproteobacteria TaxID=28211 RepID=A0A512HDK9_9HYPH|nr:MULTISPECIES: DUF6460 domain-containing protein [Alphaproteobacteria]GEO83535.1 hypothetical protein RNA01_04670 [Ciceribacter naphthalenivorans]GLR24314.1 hypothetical protein GCM10007920_41080 [Ciceribacter naphthalenivorans]GLT07170.1 hypothetical protein GCM10007926_41080 [Sphingomonas psychrolutea]
MTERVNRFLGDTPGRTLIKLVVVSLIVGFIMTIFGIYPVDIIEGIRHFFIEIWYRGFAALGRVGDYLLLGATVVVPVFIVLRLISARN